MPVDVMCGQMLVRLALPFLLHHACTCHALCDDLAALAVSTTAHRARFDRGDFDLHIDTIKQGTGDAGLVAIDIFRRTLAFAGWVPIVSTGAGIHRRDQLKSRRELRLLQYA